MRNSIFVWAALCAIFVFAACAADVNGKWTAEMPGRGGATQTVTFDFKVDGDKLTGTMTTPRGEVPISDGKVSGDEISFVTKMNFGGNEMKMLHKGKVSGNEIKFTRQREGGERTQEFTAKKAS